MKRFDLRRFYIDREFQVKYIAYNLVLLFFVVVSMMAIVIVWNHYRFYQGYLLQPPSGEQVLACARANNVAQDSAAFAAQYILQAKPYSFYEILIYPVLVIFVVNALIVSLAGLFISFKIARPIHELKMAFRRKIETGTFDQPLIVRTDDPFHELTSLSNLALFVANHPTVKKYNDTDEEKNLKGPQ